LKLIYLGNHSTICILQSDAKIFAINTVIVRVGSAVRHGRVIYIPIGNQGGKGLKVVPNVNIFISRITVPVDNQFRSSGGS